LELGEKIEWIATRLQYFLLYTECMNMERPKLGTSAKIIPIAEHIQRRLAGKPVKTVETYPAQEREHFLTRDELHGLERAKQIEGLDGAIQEVAEIKGMLTKDTPQKVAEAPKIETTAASLIFPTVAENGYVEAYLLVKKFQIDVSGYIERYGRETKEEFERSKHQELIAAVDKCFGRPIDAPTLARLEVAVAGIPYIKAIEHESAESRNITRAIKEAVPPPVPQIAPERVASVLTRDSCRDFMQNVFAPSIAPTFFPGKYAALRIAYNHKRRNANSMIPLPPLFMQELATLYAAVVKPGNKLVFEKSALSTSAVPGLAFMQTKSGGAKPTTYADIIAGAVAEYEKATTEAGVDAHDRGSIAADKIIAAALGKNINARNGIFT
jgi:hypothetical protein